MGNMAFPTVGLQKGVQKIGGGDPGCLGYELLF
jgi:hypothetical protein